MADKFNFDVFLSHNSKDKPAVENIARLLRDEHNLKAWLDKWNLVPGESWQDALEDALDDCQTFAVFLGPSGIGSWENEEMRTAIEDRVQDPNRRVIPVLLPGAPDNKDLKLPRFLRRATWVDFRSGLDDKEALYRLYCGITGQAPGDRGLSKPDASTPDTGSRDTWHLAHPYPMPPNFTGRDAEQTILDNWLADNTNRLFILRALGGFGKSALTWQWINTHVNPAEWTKLVWWSFYEGDASFEHFIEETLKYLKLEVPQGQRPQVDELLKAMQSQKILLIMDGFERALRAYSSMNAAYQSDEKQKIEDNQLDCVNLNAEVFLKSVCSLPNIKSKVLMTTRLIPRAVKPRGEFMLGCREEELTAMQPADAVEFFHKQKIKGTHVEIEAACAPYGYHPLSLRILAGLITNNREKPGEIVVTENLDITEDIVQNQHHVLEVAYNTLSTEEQKLLSNISCLRSTTTYQTIKAIHHIPRRRRTGSKAVINLSGWLQNLESYGLLQWDRKTNKYDLHPIVRRYSYNRLTASDRISTHTYLRNFFTTIERITQPERIDELSSIIELYYHTAQSEDFDNAGDLFYFGLSNPLYYQFGAYHLIIELVNLLDPDRNGIFQRVTNEDVKAKMLSILATSYSDSGQPLRALPLIKYQIAIRERLSDQVNTGVGLENLAFSTQIPLGKLQDAEVSLKNSISLFQRTVDEFREATSRSTLGRLLCYISAWDQASYEFNKASQVFQSEHLLQPQGELKTFQAVFSLLENRDITKKSTKHSKSALLHAQHALELATQNSKGGEPNARSFVRAHWVLGSAYRAENQFKLAEIHLNEEALPRCRAMNLVAEEADILLDLARLRYDQKNYEEAKSLADEALLITERCGYILQGADVNLFLAQYALEQEQDKAKAKEYAEEALKLATCDGPPYYYKVAYEEAERFLEKLNKQ